VPNRVKCGVAKASVLVGHKLSKYVAT
jgi:hypothetical protein